MRKLPPCKDCFDRKFLCHSFCGKYKDWKKTIEVEHEARKREKERFSTPDRTKKAKKIMEHWR